MIPWSLCVGTKAFFMEKCPSGIRKKQNDFHRGGNTNGKR